MDIQRGIIAGQIFLGAFISAIVSLVHASIFEIRIDSAIISLRSEAACLATLVPKKAAHRVRVLWVNLPQTSHTILAAMRLVLLYIENMIILESKYFDCHPGQTWFCNFNA